MTASNSGAPTYIQGVESAKTLGEVKVVCLILERIGKARFSQAERAGIVQAVNRRCDVLAEQCREQGISFEDKFL